MPVDTPVIFTHRLASLRKHLNHIPWTKCTHNARKYIIESSREGRIDLQDREWLLEALGVTPNTPLIHP